MYAILVLLNLFQPCHDPARAARWAAAELEDRAGMIEVQNKLLLDFAQQELRDGKTKWRDGTELKDAVASFQSEYESWLMTVVILQRTMALLDTAFPEPPKGKD
jgi:hypothetical protein